MNHNDYAGLMEVLLPISAAYILSQPRSDPRRLALAFSLIVPLASVLLSGSRGGAVSILIEVLAFGWILRKHSGNDGRRSFAMLAASLSAAALLFFWIAPKSVVIRFEKLTDLTQTTEITLAERELAARDTLRIFRDHPLMGAGFGAFETIFPRYRTFPTDFVWAHAHNDYAEALAETGAAGTILLIFALVNFFPLAFSGLNRRLRSEGGWIQFGAALGCCGLLVHSFTDFNLHIPANAVWFSVCAALGTTACPAASAPDMTRA